MSAIHRNFLLLNDQPVTCPYCSSRTHFVDFYDWDMDFQIHFCLAYPFKHIFLACDDDEFDENGEFDEEDECDQKF